MINSRAQTAIQTRECNASGLALIFHYLLYNKNPATVNYKRKILHDYRMNYLPFSTTGDFVNFRRRRREKTAKLASCWTVTYTPWWAKNSPLLRSFLRPASLSSLKGASFPASSALQGTKNPRKIGEFFAHQGVYLHLPAEKMLKKFSRQVLTFLLI